MKEDEAKKLLKRMLRRLTAGSILHLLGDVIAESAKQGRGDKQLVQRCQVVQSALFVVGLGIDAACPR